jgi:hypothetical protein
VGKIPDQDIPEVLYIELRSAVEDLEKSVRVAATHIKLRAECSAAIEDAAKAEKIAAIFRAAAISSNATIDQADVSLAPQTQNNCIGDLINLDAIDAIYSACTWLTDAQSLPRKPKASRREESKIAKRIVEAQERLRDQGKDTH